VTTMSDHGAEPRGQRWRSWFTLSRRLRLGFGVAGLVAVWLWMSTLETHWLTPDWHGRVLHRWEILCRIAFITVMAYSVVGFMLSRFSAYLLGTLFGACAGASCARAKFDNAPQLLGIAFCTAVCLLVAFGWLLPRRQRDQESPTAGSDAPG
jgi:hypothetical protein